MNKVFLTCREEWVVNVETDCYHKVDEPKSYPCIAIYYDDPGGSSSSGSSFVEYVYPEDFHLPRPVWLDEPVKTVKQEAT